MSYAWALLSRWSTRDRLALLVVAVTAAFLVGAVVVLLAVSGATTEMAGEHGADAAVSLVGPSEGTFPLATVTAGGESHTVVGVPPENGVDIGVPDGVAGPLPGERVTLAGEADSVERPSVARSGETPFPDGWLVTDAATVEALGAERGLAFRATSGAVPDRGAPLAGALAFFLVGTRGMLALLGAVCVGVAVLVGVVVFSVTRMTVRERRATLTTLRATGASARRVGLLVAARAGLLTFCGAAVGYALGVIVPNAAATAAVTLGFPVGLPMGLTGRAATLVGAVLLCLVGVGTVAGWVAARPVVRGAPFDAGNGSGRRFRGGPSFLSASALVPTLSTLSVFVAFVLVVAALGGVLGSMGAGGGAGGMVVEPGAVHPVDSHVPAAYAETFRERGVAASPEILLFLAHDGRAFPARGADFEAYSAVTGASLVAGEPPEERDEAVVGTGLARTLGVGPGDELALGGSTTTAVGAVEIVGTYAAAGAADDHLLVSLPLARHLEAVPEGAVNVVRYREGVPVPENESVVTLGLSAPRQAAAGDAVPVSVRLRNVGTVPAARTVEATFGDRERTKRVTLDGGERRTVELSFEATGTGERTVAVGDRTWSVRVLAPETLVLAPLPERAPPNATLRVGVGTVAGGRVANATVAVGDRTGRTDTDGSARVRLPAAAGEYRLRIAAGERSATHRIRTAEGAPRDPALRAVVPEETGVFTAPNARVRVRNPWTDSVERTVELSGPGVNTTRTVRLAPGENTNLEASLERRPPGEYTVRASAGSAVATADYRVTGDERLASAVASSGRTGGVGGGLVGRAFGNVALVLATLVGLGVLMTVGSTVAVFADAVSARRRDVGVHRAVGASPRGIARLVLGDAARIALPAAVGSVALAGVALAALSWAGTLTVFGVRLGPSVPVGLAPALAAGTFGLSLASAGVVVWRYCVVDPSALLRGER